MLSVHRQIASFLLIVVLATSGQTDEKPNIVLIISDDQGWTDYGFMDHPAIQTPTLDRIASQGVLFRRGYVPTALCRPSLMSLLTGQYASVHGVTGNDPSLSYGNRGSKTYRQRQAQLISKIDSFESLPQKLSTAGYVSHQSGKLWEGSFQQTGFTDGMTRGFPKPGGRHGDDGLKIGRETMQPIDDFVSQATRDNKPFFLWYAPFLPHSPHNPPQRLLDHYQQPGRPLSVAKYMAMCEWFDETCGSLVKILDDYDAAENTLVVYVCDNGWIQDPSSSKYAARSKRTPFEGGVRTPILYHWPGQIAAADRPELASSLDIYPTILAAAGIAVGDGDAPADLPGLNLLPNFRGQTPIDRAAIFGEQFAHDIANVDDPTQSLLYQWCIRDNYKLILSRDGVAERADGINDLDDKSPQLYDLIRDPHETENIAAAHPDLVKQMTVAINDEFDQ